MGKVFIRTAHLSRYSGGSSTVVDFGDAALENGYKVIYLTKFGPFDRLSYARNIQIRNRISLRFKQDNTLLKIINKICDFLSRTNSDTSIKSGDIYFCNLNDFPKNIKSLKTKNIKFIHNHAASLDQALNAFKENPNLKISSKNKVLEKKYLKKLRLFDYVLFQNSHHMIDYKERCKKHKIESQKSFFHIPPVEENKIDSLKNKSIKNKSKELKIIMIGSVQFRKGQHYLIDIAKKLKESKLSFKIQVLGNILDHKYFQEINTLIKKEYLNKFIIFKGHKKSYLKYLVQSDIFLLLSKEEGFSRAFREALYSEIYSIVFPLKGHFDITKKGFYGKELASNSTEICSKAILDYAQGNNIIKVKTNKSLFSKTIYNEFIGNLLNDLSLL